MMLAMVMAAMMHATMAASVGDGRDTRDMLPLLKRHAVQVLVSVVIPLTTIAERVGASLATVKRFAQEEGVVHVDNAAERRRRRIGRPPKAERFADDVREWLTEEPELPTQELLRRAKACGYAGGQERVLRDGRSCAPRTEHAHLALRRSARRVLSARLRSGRRGLRRRP
jgi:hypothetical protein